ncbi:MAG: fumarylacetoacetate hydrolase family protein [Rubrobacter sp.]|jgi:2-dehydro-3-deoxy-D-arabinonate dehydratase|nr:fumarylacetoacetate hydrolase family protein [Rubrobacter sp.]
MLLELPADDVSGFLGSLPAGEAAEERKLAPVEDSQEVWASGVTYEQSREARRAESEEPDVYEKVYDAERPELFLKAPGWRVVGPGGTVRVREDSGWDVPEPELVLVLNDRMEVVGYTAGNDVSSRRIEGENPLYLPQAKIFDGACSLGPEIVVPADPEELRGLEIRLRILRGGEKVFEGKTSTSRMVRPAEELAGYLGRELSFPTGAFLMTGTGIVPGEEFSLSPGDAVEISVGTMTLRNEVAPL